MAEFWVNFKNAAVASTVIALITIFLVGCLKLIPGIKNISNKEARKAIYQVFNLVIAASLAMPYHIFITKGTWNNDMLTFVLTTIGLVNALYPLYENLGARALVKKIGSLLVPSKSKKVDAVVDTIADAVAPSSEEVAKKQEESEKTGWLQ